MHLIWDWNGTLFDDHHIVIDAVNASLDAVGSGVAIDGDGYRDHYQRPVRVFYDVLLDRPVTDIEWQKIDARFQEAYLDLIHQAGPTADAHDAADYARQRLATQSILSMWTHKLLVPTVASHGLSGFMVAVRGSELPSGEQKADLLERHLVELRLNVDQKVVLIGDTFDDATAAASSGIGCVFYNGGSHHRSELVATGVPVADTLVEAIDLAQEL